MIRIQPRIYWYTLILFLVSNVVFLSAAETGVKKEVHRSPRQANGMVFILPIERVNLATAAREYEISPGKKTNRSVDTTKTGLPVNPPAAKEISSLKESFMVSLILVSAVVALVGTIAAGFILFRGKIGGVGRVLWQRVLPHQRTRVAALAKWDPEPFENNASPSQPTDAMAVIVRDEAATFAKQLRRSRSEFELSTKMRHRHTGDETKKKIQKLQKQKHTKSNTVTQAKKIGLGRGEVELARRLEKLNTHFTTRRQRND